MLLIPLCSPRSPRRQWAKRAKRKERGFRGRAREEFGATQGGGGENGIDSTSNFAEMHNVLVLELGRSNTLCPGPKLGCRHASSRLPPPPPQPLAVAVPVVYAMICAVGLAGNSAVLYVLLRMPRKKNIINLFILNLAIADELFIFILPINIADFLLQQWPFGELICKLIVTIDQYNTFSSLCFLTVMSADRYLVVLATAESRQVAGRTYRAAHAVSLAVWGLVTLVVLPFAIFAQARRGGGSAPVRAGFPAARGLLLAGHPPLHAHPRLCHPGVYHLHPLYHPALLAARHTPQQSC